MAHPSPFPLLGLSTDIDDTLTTDGAITPDALQALADLKSAGLHAVAITGHPVGSSEPFAAQWPVDAIVTENGAVALQRVPDGLNETGLQRLQDRRRQLSNSYQQPPAGRQHNYARMKQVLAQIEAEVPGSRRATDSAGRETDIAIDHSEFTHLPQDAIDHAVRIRQAAGMHATVSSIHINGWFDDHNKLEGARWIVRELWGRNLDAEMDRWVYVGDSTNDQLMFLHFAHSVGAANVARFVPQLQHLPRYAPQGERACEVGVAKSRLSRFAWRLRTDFHGRYSHP